MYVSQYHSSVWSAGRSVSVSSCRGLDGPASQAIFGFTSYHTCFYVLMMDSETECFILCAIPAPSRSLTDYLVLTMLKYRYLFFSCHFDPQTSVTMI